MIAPEKPPRTPPDLGAPRRRFAGLMAWQCALGLAAAGFALAYFAFHQGWGLPAFAAALGAVIVAQIRFIWLFRKGAG